MSFLLIYCAVAILCVYKGDAACTTTVLTDYAATASVSAATSSDCEADCQDDPTCHAFEDDGAGSSNCKLFTGLNFFQLTPTSGTDHSRLEDCTYWNYAGHDEGCFFSRIVDTVPDGNSNTGLTLSVSSVYSCRFNCLQYPRCAAFTWDGSTCVIFSEYALDSNSTSSGTDLYKLQCPCDPYDTYAAAYAGLSYEYYPAMNVLGSFLTSNDTTFTNCIDACIADTSNGGCVAVDFDIDLDHCYFHYANANSNCEKKLKAKFANLHVKIASCTETVNYPAAPFIWT